MVAPSVQSLWVLSLREPNVVIILTWQRSLPFIEAHETLWHMNLCCHDVKSNETGSEQNPHNEPA